MVADAELTMIVVAMIVVAILAVVLAKAHAAADVVANKQY